MRKVLSFVLVLALVLGSFSMAFAATPTDVVGTPNAEAVQVLMGLGVVNGYVDGSFKPAGIVTRAEMAKLIVVALGLQDYATGTSKFADMAGATWAQGYVNYAAGLGIIKGYPDGTFKPSGTVTYAEASAMIVRALGYTDASLLPATWPANYVVKAKALGILDDVNKAIASGANRGDIAQMLYNALPLAIGSIDKDGVWVKSDNDTMLDRLGATPVDAAVITGTEDSVINLTAYIGAYAKTYTNSDGDIIAVVMPDSTFLTGTFDGTGTFTADDVDYTVSAAAKADFGFTTTKSAIDFVNGAPLDFTIDRTSDGPDLTVAVDLSGKTIKAAYSVAKWVVTADSQFVANDAADITSDQTLLGEDFVLNDNNDIDLNSFDLVGVASLDKIAVDNVVYVYSNADGISKVVVGTEKVTGDLTKISSGGDTYTVGGKAYDKVTDANVINKSFTVPALGDPATIYLDGFGDIYKMEAAKGDTSYAIALDSADGGITLNDGPALVKLFLSDATSKVFDVSTDVVGSDNVWGTKPVNGTIVKYSVDKDGVVDTFNTAAVLGVTSQTNKSITASGYYNGRQIASDAVIYSYSGTDVQDADNYAVTTLAKVKDTDNVDASYVLDSGKIIAMLITSGISSDSLYGVVTDYETNSSDAGYGVYTLINGKAGFYNSNLAFNDASELVLKEFKFDTNGDVATTTTTKAIDVSTTITKIDGYVVSHNTTDYSLDSAVVVYTWDADNSVYKLGSIRDMDDAGMSVWLYDTTDTPDMVYDIVLVQPIS